jgi:hypothetical protein
MSTLHDQHVVPAAYLAGLMAGTLEAPAARDAGWGADEHNRVIGELVEERRALGEHIYRADLNDFHVRMSPTWTLIGAPDLITEGRDGQVHIFTVKPTLGAAQDRLEMQLYLRWVPVGMRRYGSARLTGWVVAPGGVREMITPT